IVDRFRISGDFAGLHPALQQLLLSQPVTLTVQCPTCWRSGTDNGLDRGPSGAVLKKSFHHVHDRRHGEDVWRPAPATVAVRIQPEASASNRRTRFVLAPHHGPPFPAAADRRT